MPHWHSVSRALENKGLCFESKETAEKLYHCAVAGEARARLSIQCSMFPGVARGLMRPVLHEGARHVVVRHTCEIQPERQQTVLPTYI